MFKNSIEEYSEIVGDKIIVSLIEKAKKLKGSNILNINSTFLGGGVSEILTSLVPLSNKFGLNSEWRVLHGIPPFYSISKKMHNALQGEDISFSDEELKMYLGVNEAYKDITEIYPDFLVIHDPQPLPVVQYINNKIFPMVWRLHIDLSDPNEKLWKFLKKFIYWYDVVIVSREEYKKKDLLVEQRVISPAIDPLSIKNIELDYDKINCIIKKAGIPMDKPIISQVSRMDKWKDPEGLLKIYEKVQSKVDCRLLYCYNSASDDPEGEIILNSIKEKAKDLIDRGDVILVIGDDPLLVNAIQSYSDVVVQKSTKEGFCLCCTEALWKRTPVVASNVGGIPSQIEDSKTGFLVDPYDYQGFADRIVELIKNKAYSNSIGNAAKESIRKNFLITRLLEDYLNLFIEIA